MDKRDNFYFNKILLSFHPCCFTLQSNHLSEPDKLTKNKPSSGEVLIKRCSTINTCLSKQLVYFVKVRHRYVFSVL